MLQPLLLPSFTFRNKNLPSFSEEGTKLCIELGQFHVGITISNLAGSEIASFDLFVSKPKITASFLKSVLSAEILIDAQFSDVVVVHNLREMALVPAEFHQQYLDAVILETIHGDQLDLLVSSDDLHQWELYNIYGTEKSIFSLVVAAYPQARQVQYMSACLRGIFRSLKEDVDQWIKIYALPSCLNIVVVKGEQLQIAQSFYYETTEDIIYHLMNVVDKYRIDVADAVVEVSGLIDAASMTWKELNKYFLNIALEDSTAVSAENQTPESSPSHYFTPFLLVPKCV